QVLAAATIPFLATIAAGGQSSLRQYVFQLPDGDPGVGNLRVSVTADASQTVPEFDATGNPAFGNNTATLAAASTLAAYPDLQVTGLSINPLTLQTGDQVTVSWNDQNSGAGAVAAAFVDYIQ